MPVIQSALRLLLCQVFLLLLASPTLAAALSYSDTQHYRQAFAALERGRLADALGHARRAVDPTLRQIVQIEVLGAPGGDFWSRARLLQEARGLPGLGAVAAQAESLLPADWQPGQVINWFGTYPPQTAAGIMAYAEALRAANRTADAQSALRRFWRDGALAANEESMLLARYGNWLLPADHQARLDRQLWDGLDGPARRMLPRVSAGWRKLAEARLALAANAPGLQGKIDRVPAALQQNAGLLYERLRWRRENNNDAGAIQILLQAPADLGRPELWWRERHIIIRRLIERGEMAKAYRLATRHGAPAGLARLEGEFMAGWLALRFLNKPQEAARHFQSLLQSATTPISRARGAYWLARAQVALGDRTGGQHWYQQAATQPTTFYGQLALAELVPDPVLQLAPEPEPPAAAATAFRNQPLPRMIRQLSQLGQQERLQRLTRTLGDAVRTAEEFALAIDLLAELDHPELAIRLAKEAVGRQLLLTRRGYPLRSYLVPAGHDAALVHALIRQESLFDPRAVSPAGARGLMQLMPATARDVARRLNLPRDPALLFDPKHNVQLGSRYIRERVAQYDGYLPLALAAYNAGQGRAREWLTQFGDPRLPGTDAIDWIELIPISETRNYVQRVLEQYHVYRARLAGGAAPLTLRSDLRLTR